MQFRQDEIYLNLNINDSLKLKKEKYKHYSHTYQNDIVRIF